MQDGQKFLGEIQSDSADVRFAAWRQAASAPPAVIPALGRLAASEKPGVAKAAREALTTMTHAVGKDAAAPNRAAVVKGLTELTGAGSALPVRVLALRLLSGVAGEDSVPAIAKWMGSPELREEAVYCLERIPGKASEQAILASYRTAADEFKPRILAALGHRQAKEAAGLCAEEARSSKTEIAVAAAKALGRIGQAVASPSPAGLNDWQKTEWMDSVLRAADAQAKQGNTAEAVRLYKAALERPEEHFQCAGVIGLAKLRTAEAATAILPLTKSANRTVRITAENAWKSMVKG